MGLPLEPHRGENWALAALYALMFSDHLDAAESEADEILARGRERGAAVTVVAISAFRAFNGLRRGALAAAATDAQLVMELAPELLGAEFLVTAVSTAVLAGLERDETPDALRRLIDRTGVRFDPEFTPSAQLLYASGVLRAAAGNHEAAIEVLRSCALDHPVLGGENPAVSPWRSAAALSLAQLGRDEEARALAADEVRRAESFGAPRAIGIALRAHALVGAPADRADGLVAALDVLAASPARLEYARVLVDLGATLRASGQRTAAREPLLEALALAARCGAKALERRSRAELAAIGVRPRATDRSGSDSLTPSERRVAELAATGGTNREIAQNAVRHRENGRDPSGAGVPQARHLLPAAASRRARARHELTRYDARSATPLRVSGPSPRLLVQDCRAPRFDGRRPRLVTATGRAGGVDSGCFSAMFGGRCRGMCPMCGASIGPDHGRSSNR